jgi:protein-ribulosamine 3-kinase
MDGAQLCDALAGELGGRWRAHALGASSFCDTWDAKGTAGRVFVKSVAGAQAAVLDAEAEGLHALAATRTVRVPAVVWSGARHGQALLVLEWLELQAPDAGFGARLGEALGALHCAPCPLEPPGYGWRLDNFIGATPQSNKRVADASLEGWIEFYRTSRLRAMRDRLPAGEHALRQSVDAIGDALARLFEDGHRPRPSLIHGDLWQGNWGMLAGGEPVIYDPAVSCSDAEAELAMMELFGAPPPGFWPVYRRAAGLHPGYAARRELYQLYHLLNHALLFGGGYVAQALRCARRLARR